VTDDVLAAPDPTQPDAFFYDGRDIYLVEVLPLRMPTVGLESRNSSFVGALVFALMQGLVGWWLWARDPRSKVVIRRRRGRVLAWFHTVTSEPSPTTLRPSSDGKRSLPAGPVADSGSAGDALSAA
jgi:hypothetical protein